MFRIKLLQLIFTILDYCYSMYRIYFLRFEYDCYMNLQMVIRTEECPMQFDMQTVCKYPLKLILSSPRILTLHDSEKSQKCKCT